MSPTRFTNSVHNAPAGYWHIATHSMRASTSLAVYDASFGAGLLEAAVWCHVKGEEVLLVACDVPYPEPLHALRPIADTMAVALVLAPPRALGGRRGAWTLRLQTLAEPAVATACTDAALEVLRGEIPAARALPLLAALAFAGAAAEVTGEAANDAATRAARRGTAHTVLRLDAADGCTLAVEVERAP